MCQGKKQLNSMMMQGYSVAVAPQWATGRENPYQLQATQDALSVFFIVAISAHLHSAATCRTESMVALVGQLSGWPVSCNAGILTPISVTASFERENSGGDSLKLLQEIIAMMTTPTPSHPEFVFLFAAVLRQDATRCAPRIIRTIATSERAARLSLAGQYVLSFAGRLPVQRSCMFRVYISVTSHITGEVTGFYDHVTYSTKSQAELAARSWLYSSERDECRTDRTVSADVVEVVNA